MREFIFGDIPIDLITKKYFIDSVVNWGKSKVKKYIFYINVHSIITAKRNNKLLSTLKQGDIVYSDGWGPLLASQSIIHKERINAADFIKSLLIKLNKNKLSIYLLGDKKVILEKAAAVIAKNYKGIKVVGYHSGFFDKSENKKILKDINDKKNLERKK